LENKGGPLETKKAPALQKSPAAWSRYAKNPWMYVIAMAIIVVVVFSGFLFSDNMLYSSDQIGGLDAKVFMRTSLDVHHQFPFWFSPRLGGMPTIDAMFGDAFYLPSMIMNALLPVHRAIGLKMILHIFLAGLFFFLMLYKGFKIKPSIAFVGGVFYMLNPEFFSHIYPGHDGKMYVISIVPFIVWQLKVLADSPKLLNATLLGLGIGMSLLTSHVQLTYFVLWGLFFYVVFAAVNFLRQKDGVGAFKLVAFFVLAVGIGIAIGFITFFPSFMYVRDAYSVRGVDRGFEYAASWSLHWPELFSLWVPEFGNTLDYYWGGNPFKLNSEYAGGIVLLLSGLAVVWKPKPWRFFWAGVAAFAALYSMGAHTPVFHICYAIVPGVKKFRACSMIMFWFSFSTILLALLFLKDLASGGFAEITEKTKKQWTKGLLIAMAAIAGITLMFSLKDFISGLLPFIATMDSQKRPAFDANFSRNFVPMLWLWFFFAVGTLGMVLAVLHGKMKPSVVIGVLFIIGVVDVLRVDAQFIKTINPQPYFYSEPVLQKLKAEMASAPFRVFTLPGTLPQNGEGIHGLEGVGEFHDNELRWYREWRGDQQDRNYFDRMLGFTKEGQPYLKAEEIDKGNAFLDIANVKYLLARNGSELVSVENRNALGRVSFAPGYVVMDSSKIIQALLNGGYDYRSTVALMAEPSQKPAYSAPFSAAMPGAFTAAWQKYTPNRRIVKVTAPAEGFLRLSEVYYPAWKVSIDGKQVPVYRADLSWMAVFLPKGDHVVEMDARSLFFGKAALVTFPVLLLLLLYWGVMAAVSVGKRTKTGALSGQLPGK